MVSCIFYVQTRSNYIYKREWTIFTAQKWEWMILWCALFENFMRNNLDMGNKWLRMNGKYCSWSLGMVLSPVLICHSWTIITGIFYNNLVPLISFLTPFICSQIAISLMPGVMCYKHFFFFSTGSHTTWGTILGFSKVAYYWRLRPEPKRMKHTWVTEKKYQLDTISK
jgi:hypothetical protein